MVNDLLIGAHMSIAGGVHNAFERGLRAGCRTIQIFLKNSNQWKAKALTLDDQVRFLDSGTKSGISPVLAHSAYLINLASPDPLLHKKSLDALVEEMWRANFLGVDSLVIHPGAHVGVGEELGISRIAEAVNLALCRVSPPIRILLETTAGQGSCLGHRFGQLSGILERIPDTKRVGICVDTCHVFAAGYDIRTEEGYRSTFREFDRLIGVERIWAFHLNDSKGELGCRVDRHAHIGKGRIGLEAFRLILADRRFARIPKILETPKGPDLEEDRMNLATLRSLVIVKKRSPQQSLRAQRS